MRRRFIGMAACLALTGLIGGHAAMAQGTGPATLRPVQFISSDPTLTSAMVFVMKAKGFDKAHGLDVSIIRTGMSSSLQIDGLLSGSADFGAPGTQTAMQAIRSGADLRIVGSIANNQLAAVIGTNALKKLNVAADAPIADRIRAMKGMTIATNPVGSTYYQMFRAYLKQYGLDADKDVRLVPVADASAQISGVQYGRYDAVVGASGVVEQVLGLKAGSLWFSGARGDLPGADSTIVCVVVTRAEIAEKQPEKVEAMRAALADTLAFMHNDRAEAGKLLKTEFFPKFDPAVWETVWDSATYAYPTALGFPQKAFDYWADIDPKGAESYSGISYKRITYGPAQSS